jgi:putative ABC transport system substrate-binding protein
MRRWELIAALGGPAAWSLAARARQPALPVVGFFNGMSAMPDRPVLMADLRLGC